MKTTFILAIASGAAMVGAQTSTVSGSPARHTVKVGFPIGAHKFQPNQINATKGDIIVFEMLPANHSVVYMDPDSPCIPWETSGVNREGGWWSGFYPVDTVDHARQYNHTVDTDDPVWFYCSAPDSCIKYQMVGVINPKNSTDILKVQEAAKNADYSLSPGEPIPAEGGNPTANSSSGGSGLSGGAIAGIVIGGVGVFALVGLLFFFVGRRKKSAELKARNEQSAVENASAGQAMSEHPPMYQGADPHYSMVPREPGTWNGDEAPLKPGHQSMMSDIATNQEAERHPHRLSELPSQNYDPVEIYTPGLPEHPEGHSPRPEEDDVVDRRRDTFS